MMIVNCMNSSQSSLKERRQVFIKYILSKYNKQQTPDGFIVYLQFKDNHYELNNEKHIVDEFDQIEDSEWYLVYIYHLYIIGK